MTPERWQRVEALFEAALEHSPAQRPAFLESACRDDTDLRRTLDEMLAADDQADRNLKQAIVEGVHRLQDDGIPSLGPYRLLRRIGAGGMGQVYLAERADREYEQRVAIKLVRPGTDGSRILARFRRERQILARLEHPHIARLLDGGTAPDGRPYLVMEYIDGQPIDQYCESRDLGLHDRLQLFRTVVQAVQHAHQQLVVHRDLKPGNILITEGGDVKLLDFGIAKILSPQWHGGLADFTTTASQPLTWSYASPEQIRGEPITTATDIYSLGVVLYQLLTGQRPFDLRNAAPQEALQRLCEERPLAPSRAIADRSDPPSAHLRWSRRLRGDLDSIVLTALHQDRGRRYGSAEQLAQDVERYLTGRPVVAHPDRLGYRAGKFLRRNQLPLVASLAFAVLLAFFAVSRARQAAQIAHEHDKAQVVAAFLVDLFGGSDPRNSRGETITVRQMLDRGAARIPRELEDNALVRATLSHTIGRVYRELGLHDQARPMLEEALRIRRGELGDDHPDVAESLNVLGGLSKAQGDYSLAERRHSQALDIYRRRLGRQSVKVAEVLNDLAMVRRSQGQYQEAEALFREALAIFGANDEGQEDAAVTTLGNLALVLENQQRYDEAEAMMRQALGRSRVINGAPHPVVATQLNNLAFILEQRGDYRAAETFYRQALAMRRDVLEPQHPEIQESLNNLGAALFRRGDFAAAEVPLSEAMEQAQQHLGEAHPDLAPLLNNLALVRKRQQDYAGARELYEKALELRSEHLGEEHPLVATSLDNLAILLFDRGDSNAAEPLYRQALEVRRKVLGVEHVAFAKSLINLASLESRRGRFTAAVRLHRQALDIRRAKFGDEHPRVASSLSRLAEALAAVGDLGQSEAMFRQAVAIQRRFLGSEHPELARSLTGLGQVLADAGPEPGAAESGAGLAEAEALLREALAIRRRELGAEHWRTAETSSSLGACLAAQGQRDEAEPLLRGGHRRLEEMLGSERRETRRAAERLAALGGRRGRVERVGQAAGGLAPHSER
ncbi:MAG: serine/threonine-protein kinase [Acidobacteriota bacterium]